MFKQIIGALFGTRGSVSSTHQHPDRPPGRAVVPQSVRGIPVIPVGEQELRERNEGIAAGLTASPLFKPERWSVLLDHLHGKRNLNKEGPFLTLEEKRSLKLNTRGKFSAVFVDCLTAGGLAHDDPKNALEVIRLVAIHRAARADSLRGIRRAGFARVHVMNANDERDCDWVRKKRNRVHPVDTEVESLITSNCDAEYCRCVVGPVDE